MCVFLTINYFLVSLCDLCASVVNAFLAVFRVFSVIDRGGAVYLLGNATDRPDSIALAGECLPRRTGAPIG